MGIAPAAQATGQNPPPPVIFNTPGYFGYVVPPGVTLLHLDLVGAPGASGTTSKIATGAVGGPGGHATGILSVQPGETLTVTVGQTDAGGSGMTLPGCPGDGSSGGGGGGATAISTQGAFPAAGGLPAGAQLVAGGGGGGGDVGNDANGSIPGPGGAGGSDPTSGAGATGQAANGTGLFGAPGSGGPAVDNPSACGQAGNSGGGGGFSGGDAGGYGAGAGGGSSYADPSVIGAVFTVAPADSAGTSSGSAILTPLLAPNLPSLVNEWPSTGLPRVDQAADTLQAIGSQAYADDFAGVIDNSTGVVSDGAPGYLDLYITSATSSETLALVQDAAATPVVVHPVSQSWSDFDALQQQIVADMPTWSAQGIDITSVGHDFVNNTVVIGVDGDTAADDTSLAANYGATRIETADQPAAISVTATEYNDTSPYNGGDWTWSSSPGDGSSGGAECTAGPPLHDGSNNTYWLEAGHCFSSGASVHVNGPNGPSVGSVTNNALFTSHTADAELVAAPTSDYIWTTQSYKRTEACYSGGQALNGGFGCNFYDPNTGALIEYHGAWIPAKGQSLCQTGIATGQTCGTVQDISYCDKEKNDQGTVLGTFCQQAKVYGGTYTSNGKTYYNLMTARGDSGAPVWTKQSNNEAYIYATAAAEDTSKQYSWACTTPPDGAANKCSVYSYVQETFYVLKNNYSNLAIPY